MENGIIITKNTKSVYHNTTARTKDIKYIVLHYVGATGSAAANVSYYSDKGSTSASADFFIGHNGEVCQYNPDPRKRYCWAVGGAKQSEYGGTLYGIAKNGNSVSIEMCCRKDKSGKWYFEKETIETAMRLTAQLMEEYGVKLDNVIRHFDVNGKLCPNVTGWLDINGPAKEWEKFKFGVMAWGMAKESNQIIPYVVRVKVDNLCIRKGPGTDYPKCKDANGNARYTGPGAFTIVEESTGEGAKRWGLLKAYKDDRDGWISLDYAEIATDIK